MTDNSTEYKLALLIGAFTTLRKIFRSKGEHTYADIISEALKKVGHD